MKKISFVLAMLLCALLCLSACGAPKQSGEPAPAGPSATPAPAAPTLQSTLPGSDLTPAATPEPEKEAAQVDPRVEAAKACIEKDVSKLYEAIGMPTDSSYAPSCLNPGVGEDGELYYDGFYVATYREGDKEIVWDVIVDAD